MISKQCRRCKIVKPESELKRDTRNSDGFSSFCKLCHRASSKAWQKANPEHLRLYRNALYQKKKVQIQAYRRKVYDPSKMRKYHLKRLYKMSVEEWDAKFESQGKKCAICGDERDIQKKAFHTDHNHACCSKPPVCGKCVRGIICTHCNHGLASIERNKDWLTKALNYLATYEQRNHYQ